MLSCFEPMKNSKFDTLTFFPTRDGENVTIEVGNMIDSGEKLGGSMMGDSYQIVLFKDGEEGPTHIDNFTAILGCPLEYASFLIPAGWYGMITKWTTTSNEIINDLVGKLNEKTA